ncbi:MAG: preprotein translocase subunit SecE [Alteromonadaceae bacterium]|nr:preprotein translocase subunit SecE [Alteromonadaceae bacterium]
MSDSAVNTSSPMDLVKWVVVVGLLATAIGGNLYFGSESVLYRAVGVVVLIIAALGLASTTAKGSAFVSFAQESRTEVRKVVWPSRQEATQTTLIVLAATAIVALFLWLLDQLIVWFIGLFTGIGG